jgi:hypothetical protein
LPNDKRDVARKTKAKEKHERNANCSYVYQSFAVEKAIKQTLARHS